MIKCEACLWKENSTDCKQTASSAVSLHSTPKFCTHAVCCNSLRITVSAFQVSRLWHSASGCCGNPSGSLLYKTHKTLCVEQKYTIPARVSQKKDGSLHVSASNVLNWIFRVCSNAEIRAFNLRVTSTLCR